MSHNSFFGYTYALNNPLKYIDPSGYLSYLSNPGTLEYASQNSEVIDYNANRWREPWNSIPQHGGGGSINDHGSFGGGSFTLGQTLYQSNPFIYRGGYYDRENGRWIGFDDKKRQYYYYASVPFLGTESFKMATDMKGNTLDVLDLGVQAIRIYLDASNDGDDDWLGPTLNYSNKAIGGFSAATRTRELLEWEYIRQARINRKLSRNYARPIKHSLRGIKAVGKFTGVASMGLAWTDYANNPTTGNLIQALATTGLVFARVNPITGVIIGVADVTGVSDYVYDHIGGIIDDF